MIYISQNEIKSEKPVRFAINLLRKQIMLYEQFFPGEEEKDVLVKEIGEIRVYRGKAESEKQWLRRNSRC